MNAPDVQVTVVGGVADVQVNSPNITVEVRDYDVDGVDEVDLWTDEEWNRCMRYFETHGDAAPQRSEAKDLQRELRSRLELFADAVRDQPDAAPITPEHIRHWARFSTRGVSSRFAWWLRHVADSLEALDAAEQRLRRAEQS